MDFRQHTALVTGASSGIGRALALALRRAGARVIATGRDQGRLEALRADEPDLVLLPADLADRASRNRLIAEVTQRAPHLSLLINNAGVQHPANHAAVTDDVAMTRHRDAAAEEIAVNVEAVVDLTLALLPRLRAAPRAAVVLMSSGLALAPKKSAPVYCASKAFLHSFGKALRYQCEDDAPHVQVMEVLPPLVDTPMTAGRGRRKVRPEAVATATLAGLCGRRAEVNVGAVGLLRGVQRLSPRFADRLLRNR